MYLATLHTDQDDFVQGMLDIRGPPPAPSSLRERWWETYRRLMRAVNSTAPAGAALRIVFEPEAGVHQALLIAVEEEHTGRLRRFFAPFTRLETVAPGSGRLPVARDEYDEVADRFPALRGRLAVEAGHMEGAWFACDFRLAPRLDSLMLAAYERGHRLGYQVNVRPLAGGVDAAWVRAARRNELTIAELPGVPAAVLAHQSRLAERLGKAGAVCEEYVGVDTPEAAEWLAGALRREYSLQFGTGRFDEAPEWRLNAGAFKCELAYPLLEPDEMSVEELCAAVVPEAEVEALLSWEAPAELASRVAGVDPGTEADDELPADIPELPVRSELGQPFVFISYRRADLGRVAPIMREAERRGRRLWYDLEIPGGIEWNAMLEERLHSCRGVLLFVSQAAVDSRWVRREAQFADSLGKPIVAVDLEPVALRHGMGLLLGQYQRLQAGSSDFLGRLDDALAAILGRSRVSV